MKLLFIRHGDPDYEKDSLTEKGWHEAELLGQRMANTPVTAFYVSPLGRAKDTASKTLQKVGRDATELRGCRISRTHSDFHTGEPRIAWDQLQTDRRRSTRQDTLAETLPTQGHVIDEAKRVWNGLDDPTQHGYEQENNFTVQFSQTKRRWRFSATCVTCVMLSHLLGISPMILWHGFCAAPTSVTSLITEERREGVALFRMNAFGDTAHLYANQEEPAFAARFCEMYANQEQRHD
ncbi:MAG: histidine phosphatase family protein [Ruminococcus sp.]